MDFFWVIEFGGTHVCNMDALHNYVLKQSVTSIMTIQLGLEPKLMEFLNGIIQISISLV